MRRFFVSSWLDFCPSCEFVLAFAASASASAECIPAKWLLADRRFQAIEWIAALQLQSRASNLEFSGGSRSAELQANYL